jgi:hypothetical protein
MRGSRKTGIGACIAIQLATLGGCTSTRYENPGHPEYGMQMYESDRAQCEKANTTLTTRNGYDVTTEATVNSDGVRACLAAKGWRPARP